MAKKAKTAEALAEEREALLRELSGQALLIEGSCFERSLTCVRKDCRCHKGEKHGPYCYIEVRTGKKKRQVYIPRAHEAAVKGGIAQAARVHEILQSVTRINLELMRLGVYGG